MTSFVKKEATEKKENSEKLNPISKASVTSVAKIKSIRQRPFSRNQLCCLCSALF